MCPAEQVRYGAGFAEVEMGRNESTPGFSRAPSQREGEPVRAETTEASLDHVVPHLEHHAKCG